ncbi:MAG: winged helix-turn-helix domain-containing protein [Candidatus Methanoperedens sp.]
MPKTYHFSTDQIAELEEARKKNKNKNVENRIKALLLRADGVKRPDVAMQTGFAATYITKLTARYQNEGLPAIVENHYAGNHRNLSFEEEEEMLNPFMEKARTGQIVEVSEILLAYEEKLGRTFEKDHGRIYRVLERHGWRKIMPRSKHPKKASDEAIDASKKLTQL